MWKKAFKKHEMIWWLGKPLQMFYEGCLPQILLGPFLNTQFKWSLCIEQLFCITSNFILL